MKFYFDFKVISDRFSNVLLLEMREYKYNSHSQKTKFTSDSLFMHYKFQRKNRLKSQPINRFSNESY
jgi:hypothetical protein